VRLKWLLADTMLDNAGLKDLLSKNSSARREATSGVHLKTTLGWPSPARRFAAL